MGDQHQGDRQGVELRGRWWLRWKGMRVATYRMVASGSGLEG